MTKPCRDSKGKFVSRGKMERVLKVMINANTATYTRSLPSPPPSAFSTIDGWTTSEETNVIGPDGFFSGHAQARALRQFRNQYKIHECF